MPSAGSGDALPVGTILPYIGSLANIPSGWAICNGNNGTPNLTGRFLEGVSWPWESNTFKAPGLPNLCGSSGFDAFIFSETPITPPDLNNYHSAGAFSYSVGGLHAMIGSASDNPGYVYTYSKYFDASRCNSIYSNSCTTVQPASYTVVYIMKIK